MSDQTEDPRDDKEKAEAEAAANEGAAPQQQPPRLTLSPFRFTPPLEPEDLPLIASLRQRLTVEEFTELMSKYSEGFILMYEQQYGEDAVVALVRKEADRFFAEIQPAPILTRGLDEPVEALQSARQSQPVKKHIDEWEKARILASLRERLGDEIFEYEQQQIGDDNLALMVDQLGEEQAVKLIRSIVGPGAGVHPGLRAQSEPEPPPAPIRRPAKKVRTREMGQTLNRRVLQVALIYVVLIGGFNPDFSAYNQVYEAILPIAAVIFLLVAVINFVRTMAFSFEVILTQAVISSILLGIVFGLVVNVVNLGIKPLAAAGFAFTGVFLIGMLLGKPIFRWIERRQLEERHGLYVGIGIALGLVVLIAGWVWIDYLVKLLFR